MVNIKVKAILASMFLVTALLALSVDYHGGIVSAKQEVPTCSVQTLLGPYGNWFQFLNLPPGSPVPQPLGDGTHLAGAGISVYTFDGQGNFSGQLTTSIGGLIVPGTVSGPYTVNANCSGSMTLNFGGGVPPGQLAFVVVDDGNEILTLSAGQGEIAIGTMKRQFAKVK